MPNINDNRELHTTIAALRYWQHHQSEYSEVFVGLATNDGACVALDENEINALCERINVSDTPPRLVIEISGGLVQSVEIDGQGVSAEIRDYDVLYAQNDGDDVKTDDDGDQYVLRHC